MKPRVLLPLIVSLLLIAAFVIGATIIEASYSMQPLAWMWAQRTLPMLWVVDAFAVVALVPVFGIAAAQSRLAGRSEEVAQMQDAHREQMEQMLHNADQSEQANAQQAEQIAALQQAVDAQAATLETQEAKLDAQAARLDAMETDAAVRHQALEEEALRIAAQAFSALMDRVEANARQMEAVSLAVQYQRAEIKQLRQGVRVLQHSQDSAGFAHLTPAELAAIADQELSHTETPPADALNTGLPRLEGLEERLVNPSGAYAVTQQFGEGENKRVESSHEVSKQEVESTNVAK